MTSLSEKTRQTWHTAPMDLKEFQVPGTDSASRHPWELARADVVESLLRKSHDRGWHDVQVLDFGCGDAFLVNDLVQRLQAQSAFAVDSAFTPAVREQIQRKVGPNVKLFDSMEAVARSGEQVSVVLMLDVIEHCKNDIEVLQEVVQSPSVSPGALFLITVPAYQSLFSQHDVFLGHHRRYHLGQLKETARAVGLSILDGSYFFSSLLLPRSAQVALEKMGLSPSSAQGLGGHRSQPFLDGLIRKTLWADYSLNQAMNSIGIRMPGLSCYVVARKTAN